MVKLFMGEKETKRAIKAAVDQSRKFPKKKEKFQKKKEVCSTCQCEFDLEAEGGTQGEFGILPVAFCPTCLSSVFDMVEQLK
jgi:hypothetical protein